MGTAKLYNQISNGIKINGIIEDYYVYAGENVSAGDFVEFVNGVASSTTETSVSTKLDRNANRGSRISAVALDDNRVFVAFCSDTTDYNLYAIVCTISGASITTGSLHYIVSGPNVFPAKPMIETVLLSSGNVFVAHSYASNYLLSGIICTISGTTILPGTSTRLSTVAQTASDVSLSALPNDKIFIAHNYSSDNLLYGMVCTISGTTLNVGTDTQLSTDGNSGKRVSTTVLSNNKIFIAHRKNSSGYIGGLVCTVEGTTITKGTDTELDNLSNTGFVLSAVTLAEDKVLVVFGYTSTYGKVCTISGTSISLGTRTTIYSSAKSGSGISTTLMPTGKVFVTYNMTDYKLRGTIVIINGTTVSTNNGITLNDTERAGYVVSSALLSDNRVFIAHSLSADELLYAQIWGVDEANNLPTSTITVPEYETQVRKAITSDIYGVAKTAGTGGDSTGHNEIVKIYTIQVI